MSVIWDQLANRVDSAHEEVRRKQHEALQQFDDAWAARPLIVDNGPAMIGMLIPLVIGLLLGAALHMAWVGVRG